MAGDINMCIVEDLHLPWQVDLWQWVFDWPKIVQLQCFFQPFHICQMFIDFNLFYRLYRTYVSPLLSSHLQCSLTFIKLGGLELKLEYEWNVKEEVWWPWTWHLIFHWRECWFKFSPDFRSEGRLAVVPAALQALLHLFLYPEPARTIELQTRCL